MALKKCDRLMKAKERMKSKYKETQKTVEKQREKLTPLNEELATVRRAK